MFYWQYIGFTEKYCKARSRKHLVEVKYKTPTNRGFAGVFKL